jgi:hypothetical protein
VSERGSISVSANAHFHAGDRAQKSLVAAVLDKALNLDQDLAVDYLDEAYEERESVLVFIHFCAPVLSPAIAADPRYKSVLARMKLDI